MYPKQLHPLISARTMLQETALRLSPDLGYAAPLLICNVEHRFIIAEQLRELDIAPRAIVLEPVGRNTAPAAAIAALMLIDADPDVTLVVAPADHAIVDIEGFRRAVGQAASLAGEGHLVTLGITPTSPHPGYGYIKQGSAILSTDDGFEVERFTEKPDTATAEKYLDEGGYLWNSGIFIFRPRVYLAEIERLHPAMLDACRQALAKGVTDLDFFRLEADAFGSAPSDSIDYAVMEHTSHAAVIPVDMGWNDIGAWDALWEIGEKDGAGNVIEGDVVVHDVSNSYIRAEESLVAAIGLDNVTIVETADAVLISASDRVQEVRKIVARLKSEGRTEHISHVRHYRPWGYYETLRAGTRYQVKHLMIKPGAKISLQMHHHRSEHWVVVAGTAKVTRGDDEFIVSENESTYIPIGTNHRLENPGIVDLDLIEVQSGGYLGEDDIVRFEDDYNRDEPATG
jgi:mannose-1-phosphate guanylyltransferase/mannose-6-phosphate isomerase